MPLKVVYLNYSVYFGKKFFLQLMTLSRGWKNKWKKKNQKWANLKVSESLLMKAGNQHKICTTLIPKKSQKSKNQKKNKK